MQGGWADIEVTKFFIDRGENATGRAYFRQHVMPDAIHANSGRMGVIAMADFVYLPSEDKIIKNRHGTIERLYENAERYMRLRHNPNESVRRLIEKAETLAALTEHTI